MPCGASRRSPRRVRGGARYVHSWSERPQRHGSDGGGPDVGLIGGEEIKIRRIVGEDDAAESDGGGDDEGVHGCLTATTGVTQEVSSEARDTHPRGDYPSITTPEFVIDWLVDPRAAVELDQDG